MDKKYRLDRLQHAEKVLVDVVHAAYTSPKGYDTRDALVAIAGEVREIVGILTELVTDAKTLVEYADRPTLSEEAILTKRGGA